MAEGWERYYAKFFYVLVGVVIAATLAYMIITDFRFAIALIAIWSASLIIPRLVPARVLARLGGWAFRNRINVFVYFSATGALVCLALFLVRGRIDWGYIITFVFIMPALYTIFFRTSSEQAGPDRDSRQDQPS